MELLYSTAGMGENPAVLLMNEKGFYGNVENATLF